LYFFFFFFFFLFKFIFFLKNYFFFFFFFFFFLNNIKYIYWNLKNFWCRFKHVRKSASFQLYKMFSIIGGIVIYHLLLLSIWIKLDGIKSTPVYSINNYEYIDCQYHKSHVLRLLLQYIYIIYLYINVN